MISKKFYTTGESAELLNISRSTISRKFDRGVFFGKKNPITGERMISRESIAAFMKQYNLPPESLEIEKKKVLLGTPDEHLLAMVQKVLMEDDRIDVEQVAYGGDVLVQCAKDHPALLIVDEEISDIPCAEVIRSLRRGEEPQALKIVCLTKSRNVRRCTEWGADEGVAKEGIEREDFRQKLYGWLGLEETHEERIQTFEHQRRWPRAGVRVPAKVGVYRMRSPHRRDLGEATVENISCGGAYLSGIQLESGAIPCEPFRMFLEVDQEPLKSFRTHCKIVRLHSNGFVAAGVQFTRLSKANLQTIQTLSE
jgi:hypothetical protein